MVALVIGTPNDIKTARAFSLGVEGGGGVDGRDGGGGGVEGRDGGGVEGRDGGGDAEGRDGGGDAEGRDGSVGCTHVERPS